MDPGGYAQGAFGGAKASGSTDPLTFLRRPIVCMRVCTLVSKGFLDHMSATHVIFCLIFAVFCHYRFWLRFLFRVVFLARKKYGGLCDEYGI